MSVLGEMLRNLMKRPCTTRFPAEKVPVPGAFRGRIIIEEEKCTGCARCARVCASQCITMVPDQREIEVKGKTIMRKKRPEVKVYRCIRCGLCEEYCQSGAIHLTTDLSGSGPDREVVVR
ncbi:MAG: 4Fe-4S binding protein [Methanoregulaceae archaeon]|nr:4Fe-4S binding protein [Methanoregulaceae archaeon]